MSRRAFTLLSLSLVTLSLSACSDITAPKAAAPAAPRVQPSGATHHDV